MAFLSMNNEAAVKLKGKPEAIYNDRAGNIDGNKKVFIPFASREKMNALLKKVDNNRSKVNPKIYDGDVLPTMPSKDKFTNETLSLLIGKEQSFRENDFNIHFSKEHGANLLVTGKNKKEKQHIINLIGLSLKNTKYIENIYFINNDFNILTNFSKSTIDIFNNEIKNKSVIIIDSIDTLTTLHPQVNYGGGFTMPGEEVKLSTADKFKELLENGYKDDIYIIIFIDNIKRTKQKISEIIELFNYRLAFSLGSDLLTDFLDLEYNVNLASLKNNKAVFSNVLTSETIEFKLFKANND
ncbi:hypothetical protein JHD48_10265 [Sulfurimonas sp. SAG-AH-194-I05]|nr:hypothetical protein [Sulfurimonas sp. SAG-AH-194-I05]